MQDFNYCQYWDGDEMGKGFVLMMIKTKSADCQQLTDLDLTSVLLLLLWKYWSWPCGIVDQVRDTSGA